PQLIGFARARRYLLTGDAIKAGDAAAMGLTTEAAEGDDLANVFSAWAGRLLAQPGHALRWTRRPINPGLLAVATRCLDTAAGFENVTQIMPAHREKLEGMRASKPSRGGHADANRDQ